MAPSDFFCTFLPWGGGSRVDGMDFADLTAQMNRRRSGLPSGDLHVSSTWHWFRPQLQPLSLLPELSSLAGVCLC